MEDFTPEPAHGRPNCRHAGPEGQRGRPELRRQPGPVRENGHAIQHKTPPMVNPVVSTRFIVLWVRAPTFRAAASRLCRRLARRAEIDLNGHLHSQLRHFAPRVVARMAVRTAGWIGRKGAWTRDAAEFDGLAVGWQDAAAIAETGLCVWRSGPRPVRDVKRSGDLLVGRRNAARHARFGRRATRLGPHRRKAPAWPATAFSTKAYLNPRWA
jgi:hypothetical protein